MNRTQFSLYAATAGFVLALVGCNKPADESAAATTPAESAGPTIESLDQRASYGIGYNIGQNVGQQSDFEVDLEALTAGIEDGMGGDDPRIDQALLQEAFSTLQSRATERASAAAGENLAKANAFLEQNKQRPEVKTTDSGLQYEVLESGTGPKPTADDTVEVHYHGTLIDGTVFDSSVERGETVEFPVTGVIQGWIEALQLMSVGGKWKLYVPPGLAYGPREAGRIPPNSALIFEVELIAIK